MNKLVIVLVFLTIFFASFIPVKDTDFGWHYRCGVELLQGNPCTTNTFSYHLANYRAYYPSFIFDAITAFTYDAVGFNGLSLFYALAITSVFYLIYLISGKKLITSALGYSLILYLSHGTLGLGWRPQIVTYGLFVFAYYFLSHRSFIGVTPKIGVTPFTIRLLTYPIFMFLWVNTHIGYFIGIVLFGLYGFDNLVRAVWKKISWKALGAILVVGIGSILATFINPYGWKVYIEIYRHMVAPMNTMIAEWVAPSPMNMGIIILFYLVTIALQIIHKKISVFQLLVITLLGTMALMANRNIPLFYTIALIQILPIIPTSKKNMTPLFLPFLIAIFVAIAIIQVRYTTAFNVSWDSYCTKGRTHYPCDILKEYPQLSGNIYTSYEYGGFMIWQKPDSKVFVDGRMSAWSNDSGEYAYQTYLKILQTQPGWNELLKAYDTDYLLIGQGTFLDLLLDEDAETYGWEKVYENDVHAVFKN